MATLKKYMSKVACGHMPPLPRVCFTPSLFAPASSKSSIYAPLPNRRPQHLPEEQDSARTAKAYAALRARFNDAVVQANIREAKEEQYQEGFLRDLFVRVLTAAQWKAAVP